MNDRKVGSCQFVVKKISNPRGVRTPIPTIPGGSLQVWNDDAWLLLDHDVGTRPCYLCVQDNILVAAAGDALMCWDINNLEDVPLYKTQVRGPRCD